MPHYVQYFQEVLQYEKEVNEEIGKNLYREDIELSDGGFGGDDDSSATNVTGATVDDDKSDGRKVSVAPVGKKPPQEEPPPPEKIQEEGRKQSDPNEKLEQEKEEVGKESDATEKQEDKKGANEGQATGRKPSTPLKIYNWKPIEKEKQEKPPEDSLTDLKEDILEAIQKLNDSRPSSLNESYRTPEEEIPPRCDTCRTRHKPTDSHS